MTCWMAFASQYDSGVKKKGGVLLKLRLFKCPKTWKCVNGLTSMMLRNETETITSEGLETKSNPSGIDLCLIWLNKECHHPQKRDIIEHWKSLPSFEKIIIPHSIMGDIYRLAKDIA